MAIEKTGAQLLRRFRLPKKNIDLALIRNEEGVLELWKNSKIPGTKLDSFTKVAEKNVNEFYDYYTDGVLISRRQFNSKGEVIGSSEVEVGFDADQYRISVNDKSLKMPNESDILIDKWPDKLTVSLQGPLQFTGEKLTPMAKRVLKLFSQVINKQ